MGKLTPEEILQNLKQDEQENNMGKLKIFLGYSAGVGKTFHMLDLAKELLESGIDVVVGYIEKHARKDTLELLEGFELLPNKEINYKNIILKELDLEEIIKRKPSLVIVDELAHTNPKGMKHSKRYQDIEEILEYGIDVYTTLNIQHIQSLSSIVRDITKIKVTELVPDDFIKNADNIELIDIEPSELLNRINSGKVYKQEKIEDATNNFFTLENLIRLREISLQYMARFVDRKNISTTLKEPILLCANYGKQFKEITEKAANLADDLNCELVIVVFNKQFKNMKMKHVKIEGKKLGKEFKKYLNESDIKQIIIDKSFFTRNILLTYILLKKLQRYDIFII